MKFSILHISDLHRAPYSPISNQVLLDTLKRDFDRYTNHETPIITPPSLVIVTGDIVQGVKYGVTDPAGCLQQQYDEALRFLNELSTFFLNGSQEHLIIVPGNHDISNDIFRQSLTRKTISPDTQKDLLDQLLSTASPLRWSWNDFALFKITNDRMYDQRFKAFADFYNAFYNGTHTYTTDPAQQLDIFDFPDLGVVIVGFCSCHNNDLFNRQGAINPDCIADAGTKLRSPAYNNRLRLALWHHNTEGPPAKSDYMDPDIVQNLIDRKFSLGFHGHQHRPQFLDTRFRHGIDRKITVISSGTLCGGAASGFTPSYNVIEIDTEAMSGQLHLREVKNGDSQMPIWGAGALPPNNTSFLDFKFEPPPQLVTQVSHSTTVLLNAQRLYESGSYADAAQALISLAGSNLLARRLLLDCQNELNDTKGITQNFNPPLSTAEAIALMDALWEEGDHNTLTGILELQIVKESEDPSIIEIRGKYTARLRR